MILSFCLTVLVITTITCEPPVNNYLPPGAGNGSGSRPTSQYGPPELNQGGFGGFNSGRGQPRDSLDRSREGSSGPPSGEYGPPGQESQGFQGGAQGRQGGDFQPRSQYKNLNRESSGRVGGSSNNGRGSLQRPESSYGVPSQGFLQAGQNGLNGQGANSQLQGSRKQFGGPPSSTYGTPDFGNDIDNSNQNYRRSGVDESNEPAKYEFSYEVDDAITGTMFGHSEQRDGDLTTGQYNVLLPDGRKQVVEYEANRDGYKPQIRYEGTGRGRVGSGVVRGGSGGNGGQGYQSVDVNADAFASQDGRYQQRGFGNDASRGYSSGRLDDNGQDVSRNQGFRGIGEGRSYPGVSEGSDFSGRSQGGGFSSGQRDQGYSSGTHGDRGSSRGLGRGSNNGGSDEGYPRGSPNGRLGSGY